MPELCIRGPFGELDLRDQLRPYLMWTLVALRDIRERAGLRFERLSSFITRASSRSLKPVPVWPT
jgi:hypothetical protein